MKVKIMQWVSTRSDRRGEASGLTSAEMDVKNAVAVARDLNENGEQSLYAKLLPPRKDGERLSCGHGVTIKYSNGRLRHVRGE